MRLIRLRRFTLTVWFASLYLLIQGSALLAQTADNGLGGHDSSQPIDVTADVLNVYRDQNMAEFKGNVDVVQGDMVLRASRLRVFYTGAAEETVAGSGTPEPAPEDDGGEEQSAIERIEADGEVYVSSPREAAQGDTGVYDVTGNTITLNGNVVLTRDENVIRGDRLVVDLTAGTSTIESAVSSSEGGAKQDRVRARFVPAQEEGAERE